MILPAGPARSRIAGDPRSGAGSRREPISPLAHFNAGSQPKPSVGRSLDPGVEMPQKSRLSLLFGIGIGIAVSLLGVLGLRAAWPSAQPVTQDSVSAGAPSVSTLSTEAPPPPKPEPLPNASPTASAATTVASTGPAPAPAPSARAARVNSVPPPTSFRPAPRVGGGRSEDTNPFDGTY